MKQFLALHFSKIILLSETDISFSDWRHYALVSFFKVSFISIVMNGLGVWFASNEAFITFMIVALLVNAFLGMIRHHFYTKSFSWLTFFRKSGIMLLVIISVYPILDIITLIIGDNIVTDVFAVTIQVSTFLYPASKILRNAYLISDKQFPPKWMMERLYNFEKTGDINYIISNENGKDNRKSDH